MIRRVGVLFSFLVALTLLPSAAESQQSGTITGRVTNAGGQPLSETRVQVVGTTRGTLSAVDGSYRIQLVPAGSQDVRALRLGYAAQTKPVTVTANGTATADFSLAETATTLDQVIVTATGETQRRRESGASVGTIDTSMINLAATPLLSNILSSRTPGVTVQMSGGTTGTGSRVRIRGSNSINLSNEPLLIVDGVRVNNSPSSFFGVGGQVISRMEDFNPEDIESIDIIKGPAAAALYGTAAANGVIQLTTKKGRAGKTRWSGYEEYGTLGQSYDFPSNWGRVGTNFIPVPNLTTAACTFEREVLGICAPKVDSLVSWNPLEMLSPFRDGWRMTHGLNASGGNEATTYYVGGEFEREEGIYAVNFLRRASGRGNVRMQLTPDFDATMSLGVIRNRIRLPHNDNSAFGPISAGFLGKPFDCSPENTRNFLPGTATPNPRDITYCGVDSLGRGSFNANVPLRGSFPINNNQENDRLTAGLNTNYTPLPWLRAVGLIGLDIVNRRDEQLFPANQVFFSATTLEGSKFQNRVRIPTYNMSGSLTASYDVPSLTNWRGQTTAGGQFVREDFRNTSASGAVLLPGTGSLNGASARFVVGESNQEILTLGYFVQQQMTFADRLFITGALRTDRNSAFGTNFSWVTYPAASVSWVISEEGFFPRSDMLEQLRLRTAWGVSGQRPVFRDAATFFSPVSVRVGTVESPGITVGGTGNPTLEPETSTEFEGGFESSMFKSKLQLELTGYTKTTKDAIVSQRLAPSLGVTTTRLVNLGKVENKGIEALATVQILSLENVDWSTTLAMSSNRNKVLDLGKGIQPIIFGFNSTQQHRNNYPLGGYFERRILSFEDIDLNGIITRINCPAYAGTANPQLAGGPECEMVLSDSVEYLGSPIPTREANFSTGITLFKYARVSGLLNYRGGYKIFNSTSEFRCSTVLNCQELYDPSTPIADQARVIARFMGDEVGYIEDASFVKLREIALDLTAPRSWAQRIRASSLGITFAARNIATWTDYTGLDPEVNSNAGNNFTTSDFLAQPPVRYFVTRVNLNF